MLVTPDFFIVQQATQLAVVGRQVATLTYLFAVQSEETKIEGGIIGYRVDDQHTHTRHRA